MANSSAANIVKHEASDGTKSTFECAECLCDGARFVTSLPLALKISTKPPSKNHLEHCHRPNKPTNPQEKRENEIREAIKVQGRSILSSNTPLGFEIKKYY